MIDLKSSVLRVSDVREHSRRAGFREARGSNKWYCAVHKDKNPSCTIKDNKIHCWTCNRIWNSIELEMMFSGASYGTAIRELAKEYGIQTQDTAPADRDRYSKDPEYWRQGMMLKLGRILEYSKKRLFSDNGTVNDKAGVMVLSATSKLRTLKEMGRQDAIAEYKRETQANRRESSYVVREGERFMRDCGRSCKSIIRIMEAANDASNQSVVSQ